MNNELEEVSMAAYIAGEAAVEADILGDNPELMELPDAIREHVLDLLWPCYIGLHNEHITTQHVVVYARRVRDVGADPQFDPAVMPRPILLVLRLRHRRAPASPAHR